MPLLVPNVLADPAAFIRATGARGVLLTGGDDVVWRRSGAGSEATVRDQTERRLLDYAAAVRLPVLGVCRGLQMINVYFGGELMRDLADVGPHVAVHHAVDVDDWRERTIVTNSFHGQGVLRSGVATDLEPFAVARDGVVEGLRHRSLPIVAVQWHPERPNPSADYDAKLLEGWLRQCA
jgi:putative glutamine amidotransferase